jgi:hypothetical protein
MPMVSTIQLLNNNYYKMEDANHLTKLQATKKGPFKLFQIIGMFGIFYQGK